MTHAVRKLLFALAVCAALGVAAPAAEGQTFSGTLAFKAKGTKPAGPCAGGAVVCGTVTVEPFGTAAFSATITSFTPAEAGGCATATEIATFDLGGGDVLVLDLSGNPCFPGNSFNAPGGLKSFGNPVRDQGTWTVDPASSGLFAGTTGSGTYTVLQAGATAHITFTGSFTIPA